MRDSPRLPEYRLHSRVSIENRPPKREVRRLRAESTATHLGIGGRIVSSTLALHDEHCSPLDPEDVFDLGTPFCCLLKSLLDAPLVADVRLLAMGGRKFERTARAGLE